MDNSSFWLDELGQISPIFSYISQFLAEIWEKISKICPKSWLDELAT